MSRSKQKTPISSNTACGDRAGAHHSYKKDEARRKRAIVRRLLKMGESIMLPSDKAFCSEWLSPRDCQHYVTDKEIQKKCLRK